MDPQVAERQRRHFKNKRATPLRKQLLSGILINKTLDDQYENDRDLSSGTSDANQLSSTFRAYVMRPPACNKSIQMKHVICFDEYTPKYRYATAQVGATTYLLAMSPGAMEGCPAWDDLWTNWKRTGKDIDHIRRLFTPEDFKALEILINLLHCQEPEPSDICLTTAKDLMIIGVKLELTELLFDWANQYLHTLQVQIEFGDDVGISHLCILGWPCLLQLSVEFKHRGMFALVCKQFIRRCKVTNITGSPWAYKGVLSWEGKELSLNARDLFARVALKLLNKRQEMINDILVFLNEVEMRLTCQDSQEDSRTASRMMVIYELAFREARVPLAQGRREYTEDSYTDGSVDDTIAWIREMAVDEDLEVSENLRTMLEQVAADADKMVTSRLEEMEFPFE
ncbi:hypothetical protein PGQ11_008189 [Apiospora arundinis]|uniref:Uncharacterized protein n=1 Tax=Apiospora arundinis TaxID=335852 RepID=A0ABR2IEH1_9PEZI